MIDYDPLYANGILPYKIKTFLNSDCILPPAMQPIQQSQLNKVKPDEFVSKKDKKIPTWKKCLTFLVGAGLVYVAFKKRTGIKEKYNQYLKPALDWTAQKGINIFNKIKSCFVQK